MTDFVKFWGLYPRKVARKDAEKMWNRLPEEKKAAALETLPAHIAYWTDREFIPYAATWLNGERWEDELTPREKPKLILVWWATNEGIERKAAELGLYAKAGEGWPQFKARVMAADKARAA